MADDPVSQRSASRGARGEVAPTPAVSSERGRVTAMAVGAVLDPDLDIEERLRGVCGHLNVLNAQLVELAAEALATGSWQGSSSTDGSSP